MQIKFQTLLPWMSEIIACIKKDIKTDFLPGNPIFSRTYFRNLPQSQISADDICKAFTKEIENGNESVSDFVIDRWVSKHGNIYNHFAERLHAVNPDFDQIKELTPAQSAQILAGAKEAFGLQDTYIFSVLNGVVFPTSVLEKLLQEANDEIEDLKKQEMQAAADRELAKAAEKQRKELAKSMKRQNKESQK